MKLADVTKRLARFERQLTYRTLDKDTNGELQVDGDTSSWLGQLVELARDTHRIERKAESVGDDRTVLAAVAELRRIVELSARLTGQLDESTRVNVLQVELSPETAERVARTYLARHRTLEQSQ